MSNPNRQKNLQELPGQNSGQTLQADPSLTSQNWRTGVVRRGRYNLRISSGITIDGAGAMRVRFVVKSRESHRCEQAFDTIEEALDYANNFHW